MIVPDELDRELYGQDLQCIYGPYESGKRFRIILYYGEQETLTLSYPKYLVERNLGRVLIEPETVDHTDSNTRNNELSNLRVISRIQNAYHGARKVLNRTGTCIQCGNDFTKKHRTQRLCSNACRFASKIHLKQ